MSEERWYTVESETAFEARLPDGWQAAPEPEEGGAEFWHPEGAGVLHLYGFAQPAGDWPDPAEELYAFLDEQEIELEEDEIETIETAVGGELAVCEFLEEDDDGEASFWLVGVAVLPRLLVFAHYICEPGEADSERAAVMDVLRSLRPRPAA
jgi:hypothetical protein